MRITAQGLTKSFKDADRTLTVLERLDYVFPERGSVAILGRSGVGKSTLLHLLGGLESASSGRVLYDDVDLTNLSDEERSAFRGRNIGFIFQLHHLLPEFTALENVSMPLLIAGAEEGEAECQAREVLNRVGLEERRSHRPGELSGGEQQRVAIARALVSKPRVVLADEPTGNLDIATAKSIQGLLKEMNTALNNVFIVVTHSHELAKEMDLVLEMLPGGELNAWNPSL